MTKIYFILLLLGFICFVVSTLASSRLAGDPAQGHRSWRVDLVPLGLAFWILVPLIQNGRAL